MRVSIALGMLGFMAGCGATPPPSREPSPAESVDEPPPAEQAEHPTMTPEECEAKGQVMGDPGDGSTHRPDYRCPNGSEPIGTVPSGIEGAVCCAK